MLKWAPLLSGRGFFTPTGEGLLDVEREDQAA